jgi:hypothetical protein
MKNDHSQQLPLARTEQLIIKEVDGEVLVYDLKIDQAHCLNTTAAIVWKNCDGNRPVSEIQAALATETGLPIEEGVVWLALDQLEKFHLLDKAANAPRVFAGMSRRQLMRNLSIAAVALPIVVSIISPSPASASSACGSTCTSNPQCTNPACNNCRNNPVGPKTCQA